MSKYAEQFRLALERERLKRGLNRSQFSQAAKKSRGQINDILSGESVPGIDTAEEIADALGLTLLELLGTEPVERVVDHPLHECVRRALSPEAAVAFSVAPPQPELTGAAKDIEQILYSEKLSGDEKLEALRKRFAKKEGRKAQG